MRRRLAILAAAAACACAAYAAQPLQAKLHAAVKDALKDPDAAKFRGEFMSKPDNGSETLSLCGELNAKNGYGAYSGFHRFVANTDGMMVLEEGEPRGFDGVWSTWCARPYR